MPKNTILSTGTTVTQLITPQPFAPSTTTYASSVGLLTVSSILVMLSFVLLWDKYCSKHSGRHRFQIDFAMALINYAISLEWDGKSNGQVG
jgi:hypothetical protein